MTNHAFRVDVILVVHAAVPPVVSLEAKNAAGTGLTDTFNGHVEGKRAEPDGQRRYRSEQSELNGSFSFRLLVPKVVFSSRLWCMQLCL